MANTLKFKRGLVGTIPTAALGEPLFTTDTFDLYIGNGTGNTRFQKYIASGTTSQLLRGDGSLLTMPIVLSSPANGEVLKYNGTNWVNSSDAGITGSGTTNYLPKFTGASTLGNSLVYDNGTNVGIGTASPLEKLQVNGALRITGAVTNNTTGAILSYEGSGGSLLGAWGVDASTRGFLRFYLANSTGTIGTEYMRLNNTGNLLLGNVATDNGLRFQVTGDGYFSGSVGIGSTSLTGYGVRNSRTITGALACYGFSIDGTIQSDATSSINIFHSLPATQAATFNIGSLIHFIANQGTQGAGSTISNQYGFLAQAGLTGATNNFGFYGNIASGTGRWNLYMNGTAANYINGSLSIGTTTQSGKLYVTLPGINTTFDSGTAADARIEFRRAGTRIGYLNWDSGVVTLQADSGNYLGFNAGGSERARIDASGNLGIGVVPSSALHVSRAGAVSGRFSNTTSGVNVDIGVSSGLGYVGTQSAASFALFTSDTERARLFTTGNLAIGSTTDAGFRLDVNGTMRVSGASTFNSTATIGAGTYKLLSFDDASGAGWRTTGGASIAPYMYLYLSGTSGQIGFYINNNPKFAINNSGIDVTGAATFSSSVAAGGTITIARGQDANVTNVNINSGVTPVSAFQINTDQPNLRSILMARNGYSLVLGTQDANRVTIDTTGAATFSSSVSAGGRLTTTFTNGVDGAYFRNTSALATNAYSQVVLSIGSDAPFQALANNRTYQIQNIATSATATDFRIQYYNGSTDTYSERFRIASDGAATFSSSVGIGGTPAQRLDVQGSLNSIQARFGNVAGRGLTIGTSAISGTNDAGVVFNAPTTTDGTLIFQTASVERARISGSGNLLINTTSDTGYKLRVNGTSYFDDNVRFPNLKGCVFVQTGGSLLGSIAMDSGNAVTIDNNGFAGLSVGGSYTMTGGNLGIGHSSFGTSATKTISVNSGTAPSTSPADAFQLYSADITAGNAAPHFRTENGGIIKLYQQTTGVTSATYIGGAGTTVTDLDTFDGYTIPQIVKALRNAGLLA